MEKNITNSAVVVPPPLTFEQAKSVDARVMSAGKDMGIALLEMKEGEGWRALQFQSFGDYAKSVEERLGGRRTIYYLMRNAEVRRNVSGELGRMVDLRVAHSEVLSALPSPKAQAEVFQAVTERNKNNALAPTEKEFQRAVDHWKKENGVTDAPAKKSKKREEEIGWSAADLKADPDIATALEMVGRVYGKNAQKAIQEGTIPMRRGDLLTLASLPDTKMREIEALLLENRWSLVKALNFVKSMPDSMTTVAELKNYCLTTKSLRYEADIDGFNVVITKKRR